MNFYGNNNRGGSHRTAGHGPGDYYLRRRRRRREAMFARGPGGPTLEMVADHEFLFECYRRLEAGGGHAPGPDGVTYGDLGPTEVGIVTREAGAAIRRGAYRPGPARKVEIPKAAGGTRTLSVANLVDRVVGSALARVLTPTLEATFLPSSFGFRPGLGTWNMLAELGAAMIHDGRPVLAVDDVRKAFDVVNIPLLMEALTEHIRDPRLLDLVEIVLRGGEDRDRTLGIPQGSPVSPPCLNVILHKLHDAPLAGSVNRPPWFRYADNLAYACRDVPEGNQVLDQVRGLLATAGLELKGADGPPVDLRDGEAQLLGFRLTLGDDRLRRRPGGGAWTKLTRSLEEAHEGPDPPRTARSVVRGWIESHGPAFESKREVARIVEEIGRIGAMSGFHELDSAEDRQERCSMAYRRWMTFRKGASKRRKDRIYLTRENVAAPPATVGPGV